MLTHRLHELIGRFAEEDLDPERVRVGIETDRGAWVTALVAAGYTVFAVNPRQARACRTNGVRADLVSVGRWPAGSRTA